MYMRMVEVRVKSGSLPQLITHYREGVIPALQQTKGCRYAGMLQSAHHPEECISLTFWDAEADALAYERGGVFAQLLEQTRPYFSESSESRIQLSQDLRIEYVALQEEPVVNRYSVAAVGGSKDGGPELHENIWVRIVSLKLRPGKQKDFERHYAEHVIPTLQGLRGCRHVYLTERADKPDEVFSVTSWETKQDAEQYERSGLFTRLLESQKHLLSELYEWKMSREGKERGGVATSEDVAVEQYDVLVGRSFK